ncbi:D-ribose pyranase [Paenibacillus sp. V4I3]|uniref:D-ribose pyranase n=1 Tax=Paenibacillus TaxID=44249 RepID=UPI000702F2E9|nr:MULTISPECIES: D-ribose pyranase [Paenibacillus]KQX48379.1 ribose pyranase [Paenibacillus sp. Root444D2]KRE45302.1 ribose pyranase [Paenibacillus sp. Soil724D2]KRF09783.1 ribose pyranase [Paenibacillus sp. Soil787]MDQ0877642.1 D-ribose pyranase [Paenibacillus sp. V4I3]MDQ0886485.1 D-ribose pyranase [Paenibacillus sp. V4I9]
MKKIGILNSEISKVISELGHTDTIVICDSGLPIPAHVKRIDLALKQGVPSFMDCLETVLLEMQVEQAFIASEMDQVTPKLKKQMETSLNGVTVHEVSHEELKTMTHQAKAIIRTGEFTPYANVILQAGVIF